MLCCKILYTFERRTTFAKTQQQPQSWSVTWFENFDEPEKKTALLNLYNILLVIAIKTPSDDSHSDAYVCKKSNKSTATHNDNIL